MKPTVIHINDKIFSSGGVETYIHLLCQELPKHGWTARWIGIEGSSGNYSIVEYPVHAPVLADADADTVRAWLEREAGGSTLLHLHSMSDPTLVDICLSVAPTFRSMHEPRMICPAHTKYWRFSRQICEKPFGLHCFWHTYTEGCANRNPKRLIPSYLNTRFEIQDAARRYSSIFVMSEYMRRESILAGIPEEQLVLNPYFTTIPEMRTRRYSSAPRRLLFVGRLIEHKGVDLMLESLAPLLKTQPHLELHLCGSGLHEDRYRRFVADNHLSDQIIFHGWVSHEDIPTHLEQADILIFPSVYPEAFGIVGIEAMARGIPVVGFDVGGVSTWLSHEESGLLIPQPDPVALREGVIHLLADNPSYQKISEQGREIARQKFSPEVHLNRLIQAYQSSASASLPPH